MPCTQINTADNKRKLSCSNFVLWSAFSLNQFVSYILSTKCEHALRCVLLRHLTNSTRKPTDFPDIEKSSVRKFKKHKNLPMTQKNNIDPPTPPPPKKTCTMCLQILFLDCLDSEYVGSSGTSKTIKWHCVTSQENWIFRTRITLLQSPPVTNSGLFRFPILKPRIRWIR